MKSFVNLNNQNETPIEKLTGLRAPNEVESSVVRKRIVRSVRKDFVSTIVWTIVSILFAIMYGKMVAAVQESNRRSFFLCACVVFVCMIIVGVVRLIFLDVKTYKAVMADEYTVRSVWIDHIASGLSTVAGRKAAKIRDENGTVYSHEFIANRKMKKLYSDDPERELLVVKLKSGIWCLTEKPEDAPEDSEVSPEHSPETPEVSPEQPEAHAPDSSAETTPDTYPQTEENSPF